MQDHCDENYDRGLDERAPTPFANEHRPESDVSEESGAEEASCYQSLVGTLRWMVELG